MKQVSNILRQATRKDSEPLNIITFPTHERYETGLCKTGHNFFAIRGEGIKDWNTTYAELPKNYRLLNSVKDYYNLPIELDYDIILSQNKFGQFPIAANLSATLQIPLISLEHTLPYDTWPKAQLLYMKQMKGHYNVFISEYSREKWGWEEEEANIIHHGIDTDLFKPAKQKEHKVLSVVNDWKNRDYCCGFKLWQQASYDLPVTVVGDTPGLSEPAKNVQELVDFYQTHKVFLNTSLISPIPTALLEAMACGTACVSTNNCMIPEIIEHEKNGFLANTPEDLNKYCKILLNNDAVAKRMGENARQTILEKFSMDKFLENWQHLFNTAGNHTYIGRPK